MAATTKEVRLTGLGNVEELTRDSGIHLAQNNLLSEWPGAVFGLITIAYLVASLVALVH